MVRLRTAAAVLRFISISFFATTALASPTGLAVYPLGDSITWGETTEGGYRDRLYKLMNTGGYDPKYAGSYAENPTANLIAAGQVRHDGHRGWTISDIDNNVDTGGGFLSDPSHTTQGRVGRTDIILLMLGTNDAIGLNSTAAQMTARMQHLLDKVTTLRPNASVILGSIPPSYRTDTHNPNDPTVAYNATLPTMASSFRAAGRHVFFADQYQNFIDVNGNGFGLPDGIHPEINGYNRMADTWYQAIQSLAQPTDIGGTLNIPPAHLGDANSGDVQSFIRNGGDPTGNPALMAALAPLPEPATIGLLLFSLIIGARRPIRI